MFRFGVILITKLNLLFSVLQDLSDLVGAQARILRDQMDWKVQQEETNRQLQAENQVQSHVPIG